MSYRISVATEQDVPELLGLITELAIYEKEPDAVKATPQLMIENIFKRKYAECLILRYYSEGAEGSEDKGEAVGLALYFFTYSTWLGSPGLYLEDLYIKETHRSNGQGKRLFGELGAIAKDRGCSRVEWRVLKWNKPSIDFYTECLKADSLSEWDTMRLEGSASIDRLLSFRQLNE